MSFLKYYVLLLQPTTEIREELLCAKIPEFYHFVIVIISNQEGDTSQIAGEKWLTRRGEGMDWNIVAWMELPKPFKEDEISVCEKEACQYYDEFSDGVV